MRLSDFIAKRVPERRKLYWRRLWWHLMEDFTLLLWAIGVIGLTVGALLIYGLRDFH